MVASVIEQNLAYAVPPPARRCDLCGGEFPKPYTLQDAGGPIDAWLDLRCVFKLRASAGYTTPERERDRLAVLQRQVEAEINRIAREV